MENEQDLHVYKDSAKLFPVFDSVSGNSRQMSEALYQELKKAQENNPYLIYKLA